MTKAGMIAFIAGEDLCKGDRVTLDFRTGKLRRCQRIPGSDHLENYLTLLPRDYKTGEVVDMPWCGGW